MKAFFIYFFFFIALFAHSQKENCFSIRFNIGANFNRTFDEAPDIYSFKSTYYRLGYSFQNEYLYNVEKFRTGIGICNSVIIQSEERFNLRRKNIFSMYLISGYKIVNNLKYQLFAELGFGSFLITTPAKTKKNILLKLNFINEYFLNKKISLLLVPTINFLHFNDNVDEYSNRKTNSHSHSIFNIDLSVGFKYSFNKNKKL
jgi:hypothetical protein